MDCTLLIADDEPLEREALSTLARRSASSDTKILVASSGTEALQFARSDRIDAALLDIKMPGLNGLDVAEEIRGMYPEATIVFLSAFDYFEYAQRAIRLKAFDYLVKPVDDEAVERVIRRIVDRVAQSEPTEARLEEARRFLESAVFDDIIAGDAEDDIVRTAFRLLEITEAPGFVLVFRPHFDRYAFPLETTSQRRTIVARFLNAFRNRVGSDVADILVRAHPGDGYALLLGVPEGMERALRDAIREATARVGCAGTVAMIGIPGRIDSIAGAFTTARTCIAESDSDSDETVRILGDCDTPSRPRRNNETQASIRVEQELLAAILDRDIDRSRSAMEEIWRIVSVSSSDESEVVRRIRSIVGFLVHTVRLREEMMYTWLPVYMSDTFTSIQAFKRDVFDAILTLANRPHHVFSNPLAHRMHEFIEAHYTTQIGLPDLAHHCALSESHCSRTFSTFFGESFTRYLNRRRINRAKELLIETRRTIGDIAITSGFRDPAYFSRVFLRFEGVRPAEYRSNHAI